MMKEDKLHKLKRVIDSRLEKMADEREYNAQQHMPHRICDPNDNPWKKVMDYEKKAREDATRRVEDEAIAGLLGDLGHL